MLQEAVVALNTLQSTAAEILARKDTPYHTQEQKLVRFRSFLDMLNIQVCAAQ